VRPLFDDGFESDQHASFVSELVVGKAFVVADPASLIRLWFRTTSHLTAFIVGLDYPDCNVEPAPRPMRRAGDTRPGGRICYRASCHLALLGGERVCLNWEASLGEYLGCSAPRQQRVWVIGNTICH
jgi:hypothetical protein